MPGVANSSFTAACSVDLSVRRSSVDARATLISTGLSLYVMRADGSDVHVLLEGDSVLPVTWKE